MSNDLISPKKAGHLQISGSRKLSAAEFQGLAQIPAEAEWFANLDNARTRRAYQLDMRDFMNFVGLNQIEEFRSITRAHVLAWRKDMENRALSGATIRRKLAALSSLFSHLCECNAVIHNPINGVRRPKVESNEGKTPAIADTQARALLEFPKDDSLKGVRDRALLSVLLYHGLRRDELCSLRVRDIHERRGIKHLRVFGKGSKIRYLPLHPATQGLISDYLDWAGHRVDIDGSLFRPVRNNVTGTLNKSLSPDAVYKIVRGYAQLLGFDIGAHSLRATAATNALDHQADIAKVQEWLGHSSIATTQIYDRRRSKPEESPTFKVNY
jgi:integrase/recombinase XerD